MVVVIYIIDHNYPATRSLPRYSYDCPTRLRLGFV